MSCNSEIWENFTLDDLWWPQFWPHIKMTSVLSLELVKTYRVFFRLSMRCVVFELAGGHICAPPPPGRAKVAQTPGRARVNRFINLWMMNIYWNDMCLLKIWTGLWDFKFTPLSDNRRHSPCRHASREPYMRLGTCISYIINTFWRMNHGQQDTGLPTNETAQQTPLMY